MTEEWLTSQQAAEQLGISVLTLYDWLAQSDQGEFILRGHPLTINYLQGGRRGQGRIRIEAVEIERIKDAMRVKPQTRRRHRPPTRYEQFPGISVTLGRPD